MALATTSQPITEIHLRRTACYGVCPDDELTIRTDGTATFRGMKSERAGDWRGTLSRDDAARLVRTIESLGFAKLDPEYGEWNIDSPDYFVTVTRSGKSKTVVSHMQQVPQVAPIITAILDVSAKVKWSPEPSGIEGRLLLKGKPIGDFPFAVVWRRPLRPPGRAERPPPHLQSRTYHALSDHDGHFRLPLLPGTYTIFGVTLVVQREHYTRRDITASRTHFSPR